MSYILDALKKIEHEKNKKNRPDGRISISGDLFQDRNKPPAQTGIWKIVILIASAAIVAGSATWFLLRGNVKERDVAITQPAPPPTPVNAPVAAPPIPAPVSLPVKPQIVTTEVPPAATPAAVPPMTKNIATVAGDDFLRLDDPRSKKQIKARPTLSSQPVQSVPAPADIKLSGIAWQDERSLRRAVINGFLLKEGASVSSGKITDILVDRVRFSSPAGMFEVKLDAVLPTEVQ